MADSTFSRGPGLRLFSPTDPGPWRLPLVVTGAGYEHRADEVYDWWGRRRRDGDFMLVQHTLAGRGELEVAGVRHVLTAGDTMLLTIPGAHRYWLDRRNRWEYFWLGLAGAEAMRLGHAVLAVTGPVVRSPADVAARLAAVCDRLIAEPSLRATRVSALGYQALMAVCDLASDPTPSSVSPAVARALRHVHDNPGSPIGIDALAAVAGMSRAHFVRTFAAEVGLPPSRYVLAARLERARQLLAATDDTIAAIGRSCGFADASYFAKAFRRACATSPASYRESVRADVSVRRE